MDANKPTTWVDEDFYWRDNFAQRPYAGQRDYEYFRPGFQYGFESAQRYHGREWNDVQKDLESGWSKWEHRGKSVWHDVKEAARDAFNRVMGYDREPVHR